MIIAISVDDLTFWGESGTLMDSTKELLKTEFEVTDLGNLHWLLGIKIDITQAEIIQSQTAYTDKILERFGMQECRSVSTL